MLSIRIRRICSHYIPSCTYKGEATVGGRFVLGDILGNVHWLFNGFPEDGDTPSKDSLSARWRYHFP